MRGGLRIACLAAASLAMVAAAAAQRRSPRVGHSRHVFVNVTDAAGAPVLDLTDADFEVTDGARKRPILASGLAKNPMLVALFIDTSDGTANAITQMRIGISGFLDAIPPEAEILMITTGRQMRVRLQPTTDRKKAQDLAKGIFSDGGATPLRDALLETDNRFFKKTADRWPVFVIITGDSAESSAAANETPFNRWLNELPARAISAHAFALKYRGGGIPDLVAEHVVQAAGGRYEFMNTANGLPDKLKALGTQLSNDAKAMSRWYEVEFETTDDNSSPVEVGVARPGVGVRVSYRRITSQ